MEHISSPNAGAIQFERFESDAILSKIASHPNAPFLYQLPDTWPGDDRGGELHKVAYDYLKRLADLLDADFLLDGVEVRQSGGGDGGDSSAALYGWLPLHREHEGHEQRAYLSRWLRRTGTDDAIGEGTAVVIASEAIGVLGSLIPLNSGYGRRVVIQVRKRDDTWIAAVTSLAAHDRRIPVAPLIGPGEGAERTFDIRAAIKKVKTSAEAQLGLDIPEGAPFWRLELLPVEGRDAKVSTDDGKGNGEEIKLIWTGAGVDRLSRKLPRVPYEFRSELRQVGDVLEVRPLDRQVLASHADQRVFEQDPASWRGFATPGAAPDPALLDSAKPQADDLRYAGQMRRTTRTEARLDRFRVARDVPADPDPLETSHFRVVECPAFARDDGADVHPPGPIPAGRAVKTVQAGASEVIRSDSNSATAAYWMHKEIYDLLVEIEIVLEDLFDAVAPVLDVHYRSGTTRGPGKDGWTVNAEVMLVPVDGGQPQLEVHLALANLSHRTVRTGTGGHPHDGLRWPEFIGIANAERLVWHEFGHVIIAAITGRLEFAFAHSAGDGMAAVLADPWSRLADPRGRDDPKGATPALRGLTFPSLGFTRRCPPSALLGHLM